MANGGADPEERLTRALESAALTVRAFTALVAPVRLPDLPRPLPGSRRTLHLRRLRSGHTVLPALAVAGFIVLDCRRAPLPLTRDGAMGDPGFAPPAKRTEWPA